MQNPSSSKRSEAWIWRWSKSTGRNTAEDAKHTGNKEQKFPFFEDLSDEIQLHIVSFLADAPFEDIKNGAKESTLTDTLPIVCKKFGRYAKSNSLWQAALERAISSEVVWNRAAARCSIDLRGTDHQVDYRRAYKQIYDDEIAFTGPVFIMGMDEEDLPKQYGLYFFEPRYRYMVTRLLDKHQEWARKAEVSREDAGPPPPMYFLHAHRGLGCHRFTSGADSNEIALLVEMVRCICMPTGHFDVTLEVNAIVQLERFWVEPNTGQLFHAHGRRIEIIDGE